MRFVAMLCVQSLVLILLVGACRILSMTFQTFSRTITIKSHKLAKILIARQNTWGIATSRDKRNRMSLVGAFSWLVFFPQIFFLIYDLWVYFTTGVVAVCPAEQTYLIVAGLYYIIAISIKIKEADNFEKGKIW